MDSRGAYAIRNITSLERGLKRAIHYLSLFTTYNIRNYRQWTETFDM